MVDEDDLFSDAMDRVQPLKKSDKIEPEKFNRRKTRVLPQRTASAHLLSTSSTHAPERGSEPWQLVADGVSRDRIRRLAAGRPAAAVSFDLHGLSREEALARLADGFAQAISASERVIRIIHGRGLHSQGKPVLKEAVYHWLCHGPSAAFVLAAISEPGSGGGACLVLLRRGVGK